MSNGVKGIIGLSLVLAIMGGGYAALRLTEPEDANDGDTTETTEAATEQQNRIIIYDSQVTGTDPETGESLEGVIKTVDIKNQTDELHVVQKTPKTEDSAATYTLDGYQDVVMRDTVIGTLANNANGLTTESVVEENCQNLEKFGLADPLVTVDVTYETGTECIMYIGNQTPGGDTTYVMTDADNTVYTVRNSALANYSMTINDFVEKTVLKKPDDEDMPIVNKLTIQREDIDYDIVIEYDKKSDDENYTGGTSASHILTSPTEAYISVERSTDITTGMFGLSAEDVFSVFCKESDIAEAGLKEPFCKVEMECNDGNTYDLLLSEPFTDTQYGKCCYGMLEGGNVIFIISADKAKWVSVLPVDIASKIFIGDYVWNVTELSFTAGGSTRTFDIKQKEESKDKESLAAEDFNVTLDGKEYDSERYRQFYSFLIGADAEEFALGEAIPEGEPMAAIDYTDKYEGRTRKIEFYEYSAMKALVVIDGESKFFISKSYVETLIRNAGLFDSEEDFVKTWK